MTTEDNGQEVKRVWTATLHTELLLRNSWRSRSNRFWQAAPGIAQAVPVGLSFCQILIQPKKEQHCACPSPHSPPLPPALPCPRSRLCFALLLPRPRPHLSTAFSHQHCPLQHPKERGPDLGIASKQKKQRLFISPLPFDSSHPVTNKFTWKGTIFHYSRFPVAPSPLKPVSLESYQSPIPPLIRRRRSDHSP